MKSARAAASSSAREVAHARTAARRACSVSRAAVAVACIVAVAVGYAGFGQRSRSAGGNAFALAAGAAQALTNAFMAPIAGQLSLLFSGSLGMAGLAVAAIASVALAAVNFGAIALTQLALRKGAATAVIPLQQLPIQAIPLILHVVLYRGNFGGAPEVAMLASGFVFLIVGSCALGLGRKATGGKKPGGRAPAVVALAIISALALPSQLEAQESLATSLVFHYHRLDDAGSKTTSIEMRVSARP